MFDIIQNEKLSLKEHNQKLIQLTSKPQHQNNGIKVMNLIEYTYST